MGSERHLRHPRDRAHHVTGRANDRAAPSRADHQRFVIREGWRTVASAHHETYELALIDGRVLRTRISRPPDRTSYGPRLWTHVLRDHLHVTEDEFWACVHDGVLPDRRPDRPPAERESTIPVEVVELLVDRVGLRREDLVGLSRTEAIERLNAYWASGR